MAAALPKGTVYSTGTGSVCPKCGWPAKACRCSSRFDETVPERIVAKLRIEKGGRGGKTVTVVDGLPRNREFLEKLAKELKRSCGAGGTAGESSVEIQGDHRGGIRALLTARGWTVKG